MPEHIPVRQLIMDEMRAHLERTLPLRQVRYRTTASDLERCGFGPNEVPIAYLFDGPEAETFGTETFGLFMNTLSIGVDVIYDFKHESDSEGFLRQGNVWLGKVIAAMMEFGPCLRHFKGAKGGDLLPIRADSVEVFGIGDHPDAFGWLQTEWSLKYHYPYKTPYVQGVA